MTMPRNDLPLTITGNLTADPELRFTAAGVAVANFTVAFTPRRYDKSTDEWKDGSTTFMRCDCWRQLGEHCAESLSRGSRVVVTGTLNTEQWEKDGEHRSAVKLTVDDIGASLAYATVSIHKAARTDGAAPATDPWSGEAATERTRPSSTTSGASASPR
jgi:single-strand DNA-binding protein